MELEIGNWESGTPLERNGAVAREEEIKRCLPPQLSKELPSPSEFFVFQVLIVSCALRAKIGSLVPCAPACRVEHLVCIIDLGQILLDKIVPAGNPLSGFSIPDSRVPFGNKSMVLQQISVYEVENGVEQDRDGPIVCFNRLIAELMGKLLVVIGLLPVLLNSHSQETAT